MAKLTFSLDDETVRRLRRMAERTKKPQSTVVRDAIAYYAAREETTTPEERARLLRVVDDMMAQHDDKDPEVTRQELDDLRKSRRAPHRLHPVD